MPIAADRADALALTRTFVAGLNRSARTVERRTGTTNAQLFLLQELAAHDALSVNALAARARTTQGTVSVVLSRLVRTGLIRKSRSAVDGRVVIVSLTVAGRRVLRGAPRPPAAILIAAVDALSARETRALTAGLRALVRALRLETADAPMLFER